MIAEEKTLTNFVDAEVQTLVLAPGNDCQFLVLVGLFGRLTLCRFSVVWSSHPHERSVSTMGLQSISRQTCRPWSHCRSRAPAWSKV